MPPREPKLSVLLPDDPLAEEEDQPPDPMEEKLRRKRCGCLLTCGKRICKRLVDVDGVLAFLTLLVALIALIAYLGWPHAM